jgi:hypothetical protein
MMLYNNIIIFFTTYKRTHMWVVCHEMYEGNKQVV